MIEKKNIGIMPDGRTVSSYIIRNNHGEYVELYDIGATIHSIYVQDSNGNIGDVVLGAGGIEEMYKHNFEGSVIGRCANRIAYGRYEINNIVKQLETNANGHFLHGASGNYAYKSFSALTCEDSNFVEFYFHDNGEGGFDCSADVLIRYSFDDEHKLSIEYRITVDGDTVVCPTNHAYFNISGRHDIRNQYLQIFSDNIAPKGDIGMPVGDIRPVEGTRLNFSLLRRIGEAMEADTEGDLIDVNRKYDECFILNEDRKDCAAKVISKETGRFMKVYTDMPAMILYTPYLTAPRKGKNGEEYEGYCALCLETQFVPNAVNCPQYASPILRKNETMLSKTIYEFGICDV